jgi:hypothetical protein
MGDRKEIETDLTKLMLIMSGQNITKLYYKTLAPNDNSKNQPYFGADFSVLNIIPTGELEASQSTSGKKSKSSVKFTASLDFYWMNSDGNISKAPNAQLILYPQYPEVRFSGFLKGCGNAPSELMNPLKRGRDNGRVLFLGVSNDGSVIGYLASPESILSQQAIDMTPDFKHGLFGEIKLSIGNNKSQLLSELRRIHGLGWIKGKRLKKDNSHVDCNSSNCGGYTLEAELGITPNGYSEPDYLGWEIKQYSVPSFGRDYSKVITLMTPEPTGGFYKKEGVIDFLYKFGYADKSGKKNRINFSSPHRIGETNKTTNLSLELIGYDKASNKITDASGGIALVSRDEEIAALWGFSHIIDHWKRKHAQAAYIPSLSKNEGFREYHYSNTIKLGEGTDFFKLLSAMVNKDIYYDPGIKMENAHSKNPKTKRRSQFRVSSRKLASLYHSMSDEKLC